MFQRTFEAYTSTNPEHLAKNAQNLFNITYDIFSHKVSEKLVGDNNELASFSDDSVSTKDSEECNEECILKKSSISQKKSYKKAPQGKMDSRDEELLLTLASKYKHDWKKVSKKIFKLHKKKLGPNLLRIRYKELAPDLTQKRVRFTHTEDLLIVKLFSRFGYDWEKIASEFESRTSIMVKNRFYHIKKKNILQSLLNEVEANNALTGNNENIIEDAAQPEIVEQEIQQFQEVIPENGDDTLQYFVQRGDEIQSQKLRVFDDSHGFLEEQLWDKVTPMGDWDSRSTSNFMEEDNGYSLTSFMNFNPRYFYF